jgi:preprotein translocase subunit SecE
LRRLIRYLKEVRAELKKVSWVNREKLIESTLVVIITVGVMSIAVGIIDLGLSSLLNLIVR